MDQRIEPRPQAEMERQIAVGRRLVRVVVAGFSVGRAAAVGLEENLKGAAGHAPEPEGAICADRIVLRGTPARAKGLPQRLRQAGEPCPIRVQGDRDVEIAPGQPTHQVIGLR